MAGVLAADDSDWGAWGGVSKVASDGLDADANQIFFTFGLLPLIAIVWRSPRNARGGRGPAGRSFLGLPYGYSWSHRNSASFIRFRSEAGLDSFSCNGAISSGHCDPRGDLLK